MIRILFILLAVVAAVLAVLLKQPLLYALAGLLLVLALVLIAAGVRRRQKRQRKAQEPAPKPEVPAAPREEDLNALGILEIRPKGGKPRPAAPLAEPDGDEAAGTADGTAAGTTVGAAAPAAPRAAPERPAPEANGLRSAPLPPPTAVSSGRPAVKERLLSVHAVNADADAPYAAVLLPYLQALRLALDAQTVCLLHQEEQALHYHIEAIVSQNAYARSGGNFTTAAPLLNASEARRTVTVRRVGEGGVPSINLGYYRESLAVRQVAMAPVPRQDETTLYFVLADTMQEGALGTPHRRTLLAEFARLLGTILDTPTAEEPSAEPEQIRPRRDIIAEEMEKARAHRRTVALALVYLNQAEPRADEGPEAVAAAEKALETHLRKATRQGRVERFGELTFGVFYPAPAADVEAWAMQLQNELAGAAGALEGGISIGIAMLQDRHRDPDAFRADATAALSEAFETGTCTIVE